MAAAGAFQLLTALPEAMLLTLPGRCQSQFQAAIGTRLRAGSPLLLSNRSSPAAYSAYWGELLGREYREATSQLKERRAKWPRGRLESSGLVIFDADASPETDLFGEKIVRVSKPGAAALADRFSRGDVLVMSQSDRRPAWSRAATRFAPRECCVVETGDDWVSVSVGLSWPVGLWEARRRPGSFGVRLDRVAPQGPLKAQREALRLAETGAAGGAAALLASDQASVAQAAAAPPARFADGAALTIDGPRAASVEEAIDRAVAQAKSLSRSQKRLVPNESQEEVLKWALGRRLSLVRGPPGTGKTRTAALLISSALRLRGWHTDGAMPAPRVLAVAHSNGAADVLLEALLDVGVAAVRAGRPGTVAPSARRRTAVALAEQHPEVVALRAQARNTSLSPLQRSAASFEARRVRGDVCDVILRAAHVVVSSCIGARALGEQAGFDLVVLDEGSQTTEPALICALAAAKAEQLVIVGDTRQLPPTVVSGSPELRRSLGRSPMARLESAGVGQRTLRVQYRMPQELLEHPSRYFYDSLVACAPDLPVLAPPRGFDWPGGMPICFVDCGHDLEVSHDSGGKSNPVEAELVARMVADVLAAGDLSREQLAVIAPYSNQVDEVRKAVGCVCRVGTVDSFQGQETELVLFSATRSNAFGDLGFLSDPRRLCVAITRARRGLILVGDSRTLRSSHHWSALIDSCRSRGCFVDSSVHEPSCLALGVGHGELDSIDRVASVE